MKRLRIPVTVFALLLVSVVSILAAPAKKSPGPEAARGKSVASSDSDAVLVRVGKQAITRRTIADRLQEVPEQYRANYQTPDGRQQLLQRIIEEHLWLQDAEAHGLPTRPEIERQLRSARRDLLIRTWVNEVVSANAPPSDSEAKAYFDAHTADFKSPASVSARHILLKTEPEARKVLALARAKGADWGKLVTQYSTDSLTRATGGNLGSVTKEGQFVAIGTQPALAESLMALGEGNIGGPYKTAKGWHVIKVDAFHAESTHPFDQVKSFVVRQLTQQRQQGFYQEQLEKTRTRIGVTPDSAAIKNFLSARRTAREMFQDAQNAGAADKRIEGYRDVVKTYPDADIAPQALFMVGFIQSEELKSYDDAEKAFRQLLATYPKSELATSAQWMVDHMRSEDAPSFPGADSVAAATAAGKGPKK